MALTFIALVICVTIISSPKVKCNDGISHNVSEWSSHRISKRYLIYPQGGISKIVCGVILPVALGDHKPWRQLNLLMNFQAQYAVPTTPIYWLDKWSGRSLADAKNKYFKTEIFKDYSSQFFYMAFEAFLNRKGYNGRSCLQKAICENFNPEIYSVGVVGKILSRILTPGQNDEQDYWDAAKAGSHGVNCRQLFKECPYSKSLLDHLSDVNIFKKI